MRRFSRFGIALTAALTLPVAASAQAPLPPSAPADLPAGHPQIPSDGAEEAPRPTNSLKARIPKDLVTEDPTKAPGTITVMLRDADERPVAGESVMLALMSSSPGKGESRKHLTDKTDANGTVAFQGLSTEGGPAARISVAHDGGTFGATPFQLQTGKAMQVVLHVYPVTHNLAEAMVALETEIDIELKDDRIQFEQTVAIVNAGRTAWVPDEAMITLPSGYTALTAQPVMGGGQAILPIEGQGARIVGTFAPSDHEHMLNFRWQLPWSDEETVNISQGLPANVVVQRVVAVASPGMELVGSGFGPAHDATARTGQRLLVADKQFKTREETTRTLDFELRHLPTRGPGPRIALGLASVVALGGLYFALTHKRWKTTAASGRDQLLGELEALEQARAAGDVGPETYQRMRRQIVEALARILAQSAA